MTTTANEYVSEVPTGRVMIAADVAALIGKLAGILGPVAVAFAWGGETGTARWHVPPSGHPNQPTVEGLVMPVRDRDSVEG